MSEKSAMDELGVVQQAQDVFGRAFTKFKRYVDEREDCRSVEEQSKEARGYNDHGKRVIGIDDKIHDMLADLKEVVLPDGRKVQVVEKQGNEYVDIQLLLEAGVSPEIIRKCKRRGAGYWYILVTSPKGGTK